MFGSQSTACTQTTWPQIEVSNTWESELIRINKEKQQTQSKIIQLIAAMKITLLFHVSFDKLNFIDTSITPIPQFHYQLKQLIYCNGRTPLRICCHIIQRIIRIVATLHSIGISHTNLSAGCIHIIQHSNVDSENWIYLSDFENATFDNKFIEDAHRNCYYSNEKILSNSYSPKHRDNYSLAAILYVMAFGFTSFICNEMSSLEYLQQTGALSLNSKRIWSIHAKWLRNNGEAYNDIKEFKEVFEVLRGKEFTPLRMILKHRWFSTNVPNSEVGEYMERLKII